MESSKIAVWAIILALLGMAPVTESAAATLHVEAGAPAGGDGSSGSPFDRIGTAMAAADPGDTVRIGPGTFSDTVVTSAYGNPRLALLVMAPGVTVIGAGRSQTVLYALPADTLTFGITAEDLDRTAEVRDLTISGACFHGINTRRASPRLVSLEVVPDLVGASSTAADFRDGSDPEVRDCLLDGGHGSLFVEFGSTGTFTDCVFGGGPNDTASITQASPTFLNCRFEAAGRDVLLLNGGSQPVLNGCTLADGARWAVRVTGYPEGSVIDLGDNTWFSSDPEVIRTRILDAADNPALGATVLIEPLGPSVPTERQSLGSFKAMFR